MDEDTGQLGYEPSYAYLVIQKLHAFLPRLNDCGWKLKQVVTCAIGNRFTRIAMRKYSQVRINTY